ncbi:sn-glycerol-3-phosphate ABC transporter permease UgpA [Legionella oakridgensis]|uniref:sn-glycerol-3-phosphate transport system permease protein UgpA n=2 Tax=Legionella oakridgensis TaxID=29423 RepID=W0BFT2_9GAMM|nr:sn-glycerol-3-phosphate ABC transporter permease UgpA [Legionella oakridgensis]AHE67279.1 ABC-type sugar transport systems, permease component [Legionella oakridgensis ATCC 33761 = DSM 21215]ETO93108.1 carbohydrate ABC transporter ATP-binding protein, CUT1 family [Legionella oakridgensis RV-2-2007]KTD37933.1 sn-glycerol-3-phosphate transmembrane ABC transporter [Legionella oakridgensis]STY20346.1 sn-glycerol 3-phosphate transport system permease protein [Legionella longbeachae]
MANYNQQSKLAFLFIMPQLLVTVLFFIWPACKAIWQSLFFSDAFGLHHHFAGLANFMDLLSSADYLKALNITLLIAFAVTLLTMTLGLTLALMVYERCKKQQLYKALLLWPYAVAPAVAAILWRFLFHPTLGWMTRLLNAFGMDFNYLIHAKQALFVVIMTASWQQFSYNFLFFFAALKLIPRSLIEAAMIDGASAWRRFWQIIFPLLSPTTFFLLTMNVIYSFFDTFGIIQVITHGGPEYSTTTLIYKVYEDGFVAMDPGSSSAQSVILMLIVIGLTLLQFRYLEKRVHYQ